MEIARRLFGRVGSLSAWCLRTACGADRSTDREEEEAHVVNRRKVEFEGERGKVLGEVSLLLLGVEIILVRRTGVDGDQFVHVVRLDEEKMH